MKINNQRGFTIVELVVTIAVASVVSVSIFSFLVFAQRLYVRSTEQAAITSEVDYVVSAITTRAREATSIEAVDNRYTILYDTTPLLIIDYTASSNLITLTSGTSQREVNNVTNFSLVVDDSGKNADIVIEGRTKESSASFSTSVTLRNSE